MSYSTTKPKGNWIKLHRELGGHSWLNSRADWFMAWSHILLATDHSTGYVNLTEVKRGLAHIFNTDTWRYFIDKCKKDHMLVDVQVVNLGKKAGQKQTASVVKWFEYNAIPTQKTQHSAVTDSDSSASPRSTSAHNPTVLQEGKDLKEEEASSKTLSDEEKLHNHLMGKPSPTRAEHFFRELVGRSNLQNPQIRDSFKDWFEDFDSESIKNLWLESKAQDKKPHLFFFVDALNGSQANKSLKTKVTEKQKTRQQFKEITNIVGGTLITSDVGKKHEIEEYNYPLLVARDADGEAYDFNIMAGDIQILDVVGRVVL